MLVVPISSLAIDRERWRHKNWLNSALTALTQKSGPQSRSFTLYPFTYQIGWASKEERQESKSLLNPIYILHVQEIYCTISNLSICRCACAEAQYGCEEENGDTFLFATFYWTISQHLTINWCFSQSFILQRISLLSWHWNRVGSKSGPMASKHWGLRFNKSGNSKQVSRGSVPALKTLSLHIFSQVCFLCNFPPFTFFFSNTPTP